MTTPQLPERPNLEQLKRQAKDLLRAALANEPAALAGFRALPGAACTSAALPSKPSIALHDAQCVSAREYGFPSWNALRERVEVLTLQFAEAVAEFVRCSVDERIGRA